MYYIVFMQKTAYLRTQACKMCCDVGCE